MTACTDYLYLLRIKIQYQFIPRIFLFNCFLLLYSFSNGQTNLHQYGQKSFLTPSDTLSGQRIWTIGIGGATAYSLSLYALNNAWYKQYPRGRFRFFDDSREWLQMDKAGHTFSGYFISRWTYQAFRWAGISDNTSVWLGMSSGMLVLSTIEVLDGFSEEWGFSVSDMGANVVGVSIFGLQQHFWKEQRIQLKVVSSFKNYDNAFAQSTQQPFDRIPLSIRAGDLFGHGKAERFLKDYNAQSIWLSANIKSFFPSAPVPSWVNLALGYSGENMMGGFSNSWEYNGNTYLYAPDRFRQFFLSPDIDWTRIPVKSTWWKTFFEALNVIKVPLPGLEWNTNRELRWRWLAL